MKKTSIFFLFFCVLSDSLIAQSGMDVNSIPKFNGSTFVNGLMTDDGTMVGIRPNFNFGSLNIDQITDAQRSVLFTHRYIYRSTNTPKNGASYSSWSHINHEGNNITTNTWSPVYAHTSQLYVNTTGTLTIQGAGTEFASNQGWIGIGSTQRVNGLVSGFSSYLESMGSGGLVDAVAGYRVRAPAAVFSQVTNISNFYGLLIDDIASDREGQMGINKRWGIYQQGSGDMNYFNGNVLLGTTVNAGYRLDVNGGTRFQGAMNLPNISTGVGTDSLLSVDQNGSVRRISPSRITTNGGVTSNNLGTANYLAKFTSASAIANSIIYDNGTSVGIGTTDPGPYKLAVEGTIGARKLKVTQAVPWADYVFEPAYQLRPLSQVEVFIKENKHLPEVPSTKEVEKNGIDVGETAALLLKKIEELTLYMIEMKKENEEIKRANRQQQKEIESLKKQYAGKGN